MRGITRALAVATLGGLFGCSGTEPLPMPGAQPATALGFASVKPRIAPEVIYVANARVNSILAFASGKYGNVKPLAVIKGNLTQIDSLTGLAITGKLLYATNYASNSIIAFGTAQHGNVAPAITIQGSKTKMDQPSAIATDSKGNVYVTNFITNSVLEFKAGAKGNVAPIRTIKGANTKLVGPQGIAIDTSGNIYVASKNTSRVTVYASTANGNVAPIRTIQGNNTGLYVPAKIFFEDNYGTQYITVASAGSESVSTFLASANGNAAPKYVVNGTMTLLNYPVAGIFINTGQLYVANYDNSTITIYNGTGNTAPAGTISGTNTKLNQPIALVANPV